MTSPCLLLAPKAAPQITFTRNLPLRGDASSSFVLGLLLCKVCLFMQELHSRFGGRIRYAMLDFWRLQ